MIKYSVSIFSLLLILFLAQCKPKEEPEEDISNFITLAEDEAFAMWVYNDILQLVFTAQSIVHDSLFPQTKEEDTIFNDLIEPCYIITADDYDPASWPKEISITFLDSCKDISLITRTDSILFKTSGIYAQDDTLINIYLKNYSVNNMSIEGDITIQKIADSTSAYLAINIIKGKIIAYDSISITRKFNDLHFIWQGKGDTTISLDDDIFQVSGSFSGTHSTTGTDYINDIDDTLEYRMNCNFIQTGVTILDFTEHSSLGLDFGNPNCDNLGIITTNDVSKTFISDYKIFRTPKTE